MPTDPRKRQKKLEKRTAKRNEKKHLVKVEQSAGLAERLLAATRFPILNCQIAESLEETGLGWVMLSRGSTDGRIAVANFLVDVYCLGVKNIFVEEMNRSSYQDKYFRRMKAEMPAREVPPAEARKLLEEAVAYARGIGFPPHHDYAKAVRLFGDVNSSESNATFEFGKNGRPFYASGPYESPERVRQILAILSKTSGPAGPQYMVAVDPTEALPGGLTPGQMHLLGPDQNAPEKVIEDSQAHVDPGK